MQQEDEIDLFELFAELYRGKWLIISGILVAMACGGSYAIVKEKSHVTTYQSVIAYSPKNLPLFIDAEKAVSDFGSLFYSQSAFEAWKVVNAESRISYSDISPTQIVDGVELSNEPKMISPQTSEFILKTADLGLLDDYYSYLTSLNDLITKRYVTQAAEEKRYIEKRFKDFWAFDEALEDKVLIFMRHLTEVRKLDRYVELVESGAKVFSIRHPTPPVVTSPAPKTNLILALSFVLGGFIGAASVLLRNAIRRRSETSKSG